MNTNYENLNEFMHKLGGVVELYYTTPQKDDLFLTVGDFEFSGFTVSDVQKAFADCHGDVYTMKIKEIKLNDNKHYRLQIIPRNSEINTTEELTHNKSAVSKFVEESVIGNHELYDDNDGAVRDELYDFITGSQEEVNMNTNYSFVPAREMNAVANEFISNNLNFISDCINIRASRGHFNWFYSTTSNESEADWEIAIKGALIAAGYEVERTYSGDEDGSWGYRISW